jgi:cytochrome c
MNDLRFNKVAGALLATGLVIFGVRELTTIAFQKPELEKPGYKIDVAETTEAGGAAADVMPDWGTVLPTANVAAGAEVAKKCQSCHNFDPGGPNQTGPNLYGVMGRKPGSHPGFAYSTAMTDFGGKTPAWDYGHLFQFLKSPQGYINGTKMSFVGLKKPEDRVAVIAYLRSLSPSPAPIPAPDPKAAAAAAGGGSDAPAASGATDTAVTGSGAPGTTGKTGAKPSVVGSSGTASNIGAQGQAPKGGAAAAPTQVNNNPPRPRRGAFVFPASAGLSPLQVL